VFNASNVATSVFLRLGSAGPGVPEGGVRCQWFREMKMCSGGRFLLAIQNMYV
jgi:hypothetical protein